MDAIYRIALTPRETFGYIVASDLPPVMLTPPYPRWLGHPLPNGNHLEIEVAWNPCNDREYVIHQVWMVTPRPGERWQIDPASVELIVP